MIEVSILIVCYKSLDLISECLEGVYKHTSGVDYEVLLLDCSNDGTVEFVRQRYPQTTIVDNTENLGFARGNNVLAKYARGKYLVLLNPDAIVTDNSILQLYQTAVSMPRAAAIGGRARLPNGQRDPGCRQCIPTLFRTLIAAVGGAKLLNGALAETATDPGEVETLSGAFMLVRSDAWNEVNGFDSSFFMYSEELDLCYRLRKRGWEIVMTPKAEVIHMLGGGNLMTPERTKMITTAKMHFFRKYWNRPSVWLGGAFLWLHGLIRVLIGSAVGLLLKRERARTLCVAYTPIVFQPKSWWRGFDKNHYS